MALRAGWPRNVAWASMQDLEWSDAAPRRSRTWSTVPSRRTRG